MMLGRAGYEKAWCLYYNQSKKNWVKHHLENQITKNTSADFKMWATRDIAIAAISREQQLLQLKLEGKTEGQIKTLCPSIGVKEMPLWMFIPVTQWAFSELHTIIGIGNKIQNKF